MDNPPPATTATAPANATYYIEQAAIQLTGGQAAYPAAPGSAERIEARLFDAPAWGDLDGDDDEDAAVLLLHRKGGSGSFYYVAAAIRQEEGFSGTNAILLGDRIAPQSVQVRNGVLIANYADRRREEPMTSIPTEGRTKYLTLRAGQLVEAAALGEGMQVLEGWVTIGHEVRAFQPCGHPESLWLDPGSDGFKAVQQAHASALPPDAQPYTPVFMTLAGRLAEAPTDGFGRDYGAAFRSSQFLQVWPGGNCRADRVRVTTPVAGSVIRSPLRVSGWARGPWFFEGDFPIHLRDHKGRILATGIAAAKGPWMTQAFVPFEATLQFTASPQPSRGFLVLVKNNPSDDHGLDDAVELPVFYH